MVSGGLMPHDELRGCRHAGRYGQYLVAGIGDQNGMFPLRREAAIARDDGPAVGEGAYVAPPGVDHGFDGEDHARFEALARAGLAIVQHLRILVELAAHTVTTVFAH